MTFKECFEYQWPEGSFYERDGYQYLNWLVLLKTMRIDLNMDVEYWAERTEYHTNTKDGYATCTVHVAVIINGSTYNLAYPVADGWIPIKNPNAMQIHWAQQRAFVKCVAINTGLGLHLWEGGNNPDKATEPGKLGSQITKTFGEAVPVLGEPADVFKHLGIRESELAEIVKKGSQARQQEIIDKLSELFQDDIDG